MPACYTWQHDAVLVLGLEVKMRRNFAVGEDSVQTVLQREDQAGQHGWPDFLAFQCRGACTSMRPEQLFVACTLAFRGRTKQLADREI